MNAEIKNPVHANIARNNSYNCKMCKKRFRQEGSLKLILFRNKYLLTLLI